MNLPAQRIGSCLFESLFKCKFCHHFTSSVRFAELGECCPKCCHFDRFILLMKSLANDQSQNNPWLCEINFCTFRLGVLTCGKSFFWCFKTISSLFFSVVSILGGMILCAVFTHYCPINPKWWKCFGYQKAEVLKGFDAGTTWTPLRGVSMSVRLQISCGQVGHVRYLSCLSSFWTSQT